jgi:dipeptidase D
LVTVSGGKAHNAIPREAEAVITLPAELHAAAAVIVDDLAETLRCEHRVTDPELSLILAPAPTPRRAFSAATTRRVLDFLAALPDGVADFSQELAGAVETSSNLASVAVLDGHLTAMASQRGSRPSRLELHTDSLEAVARLAGGTVERLGGYGPWAPQLDSFLLRRAREVYAARFGREPAVSVVHAGLECGALVAKRKGLEVISLGPTIEQPHSPAERLHVPSVGRVWDLLAELLRSFAADHSA